MQRHIQEFGPIWISFMTTSGFQNQDWKKHPVHTGSGSNVGEHVVVAIGRGKQGVDYWLLRNSWSYNWADKGHCKFQRGVNLDQIESRGVGASMPTKNFKDWSPPVCFLSRWTSKYWHNGGGKLTKYLLNLQICCDKACSLNVFVSNRLTNRKQIHSSVNGNYYKAKGVAQGAVPLDPIEMTLKDFGLYDGDAWVQITADDGKGNSAKSAHFVEFNHIPGMTSIR